jgi:uncharacterized protein DUF3467
MTTPQNQERQIQLRIDESKMATTYANTIRTSTMPDEIVMDFGINMPMPTPDNQPTLVFSVGSRVVMNWSAAKRLAIEPSGSRPVPGPFLCSGRAVHSFG